MAGVSIMIGVVIASTGCAKQDVQPVSASAAIQAVEDGAEDLSTLTSMSDFRDWCEHWASDRSMCRISLKAGIKSLPVTETASSEVRSTSSGGKVVTVTGTLANKEAFSSEVEVVRDADGSVRAVDPVYWVPRVIEGSNE
ncbi:hypothetical protein QT381_13945 [Galbitalea sp. SE-J8]|uniref:hypothetical protein n=1 Tax=Galbitalea sp. SE-J8 TaxID=3054952 RepID=UPI00259D260B|nr:hypothetical protein [Galbitalea sp. SE-J8]MDM4764109.1 hypothetical protein [Galbitalea sp. SE-J8]